MPNYNGVWSLATQYQYASDWQADNRAPLSGDIGLTFAGVSHGTFTNYQGIEATIITTTGSTVDYGTLDVAREGSGAFSSSTRYVMGGHSADPSTTCFGNYVDYGTAVEFGNLTVRLYGAVTGASNNTRGVIAGGNVGDGHSNVIAYCTIDTTGDFADFGDLSAARATLAGLANTTRAVFGGGDPTGASHSNVMDYITIGSTGNASDFGDLSVAKQCRGGAASSTRGLFMGGYSNSSPYNLDDIEYITIASTGNATDFGNLTVARRGGNAFGNGTRAIGNGGSADGTGMDFVTIASTGNASDFGDSTGSYGDGTCATSNSHGGIS